MKFSSKLLVSSLLVVASGLTYAQPVAMAGNYKGDLKNEAPCPPPPMLMNGFYLGVQGGYDSYRIRHSYSNAVISTTNVGNLTGWEGGLFAGYGMNFDLYYLGAEIDGYYSGADAVTSSLVGPVAVDSGTLRNKAKWTWGVSLLPGMMLNNASLGYVRLGYDWTKFESHVAGNFAGAPYSASGSKTQGGFVLGLGMDTLLMQNWSLRTEYNHVWYSNFSTSGGTNKVSDNQFNLGVLYRFIF